MSGFNSPDRPNGPSALVPLPELAPFMEQVTEIAEFLAITSNVGTAAEYQALTDSIREGACLIKKYRDKHVSALNELEQRVTEWNTSIELREAELDALEQRKNKAELDIETRAKELAAKHAGLLRLQNAIKDSEKLLEDSKTQLESKKADLVSIERQRFRLEAEIQTLEIGALEKQVAKLKAELNAEKVKSAIAQKGKEHEGPVIQARLLAQEEPTTAVDVNGLSLRRQVTELQDQITTQAQELVRTKAQNSSLRDRIGDLSTQNKDRVVTATTEAAAVADRIERLENCLATQRNELTELRSTKKRLETQVADFQVADLQPSQNERRTQQASRESVDAQKKPAGQQPSWAGLPRLQMNRKRGRDVLEDEQN